MKLRIEAIAIKAATIVSDIIQPDGYAPDDLLVRLLQTLLDGGDIALPDEITEDEMLAYKERFAEHKPMSYEEWMAWRSDYPHNDLLFFATYIGPLVIWTQDSRIGDLEHETEQLGAELYEVDH